MKYRSRAMEDIHKIYEAHGFNEFEWHEVREFCVNSPQYYRGTNLLEVVRRVDSHNVYKIRREVFKGLKLHDYRIRREHK